MRAATLRGPSPPPLPSPQAGAVSQGAASFFTLCPCSPPEPSVLHGCQRGKSSWPSSLKEVPVHRGQDPDSHMEWLLLALSLLPPPLPPSPSPVLHITHTCMSTHIHTRAHTDTCVSTHRHTHTCTHTCPPSQRFCRRAQTEAYRREGWGLQSSSTQCPALTLSHPGGSNLPQQQGCI